MNPSNRRRHKNLLPTPEDVPRRPSAVTPPAQRRRHVDQAAGSAWMFADFLAALMTLPPDKLGDLE